MCMCVFPSLKGSTFGYISVKAMQAFRSSNWSLKVLANVLGILQKRFYYDRSCYSSAFCFRSVAMRIYDFATTTHTLRAWFRP